MSKIDIKIEVFPDHSGQYRAIELTTYDEALDGNQYLGIGDTALEALERLTAQLLDNIGSK